MKLNHLFLLIIFCLVSISTYGQSSSQDDVFTSTENQQFTIASCLKDLEELGYCVIPEILSRQKQRHYTNAFGMNISRRHGPSVEWMTEAIGRRISYP